MIDAAVLIDKEIGVLRLLAERGSVSGHEFFIYDIRVTPVINIFGYKKGEMVINMVNGEVEL